MPSRHKRKRHRRTAEATAPAPESQGGWGAGYPTSLSDLVLLRKAINEGWPVPFQVRLAIVSELGGEIKSPDVRRALSVARSFLAMDRANICNETLGRAG
jgi:hypothetical protein